jgi:hypothetical protein
VVDHTAVIGTCNTCHNGVTASGKPATHIVTSAQCDACHSTLAWTPAHFDHAGVSGSCSTCHNGTSATGKPANHVLTTAQCDVCHTTTAWTPVHFDHSAVSGSCSTCHNGTTATGKNTGHFITTQQCNVCHTTTVWTPISFRHSSPNYPGDHGVSLSCSSCHSGNSETVPWPYAAYQPACAACHAAQYKPSAHGNATVATNKDCAGSCHIGTTTRSAHHRVTDRSFGD